MAADAPWVVDEVAAAVSGPDCELVALTTGLAVRPWLEETAEEGTEPDLVVLDLQIGNMGGMAVCQELRLEEDAGRLPPVPVLMLLDRRADVFLAKRVDAEGWLVKPLDPIRIRRAVNTLLAGGTYYDGSYAPEPILIAAPGQVTEPAAGPPPAH